MFYLSCYNFDGLKIDYRYIHLGLGLRLILCTENMEITDFWTWHLFHSCVFCIFLVLTFTKLIAPVTTVQRKN